jgi:hypothetical protein
MTGLHAALDSVVQYLTMHGYHQLSALPLIALLSINNLNSLLPLGITLKHLSSTLMIAVLMRKAARRMTVQQLYL